MAIRTVVITAARSGTLSTVVINRGPQGQKGAQGEPGAPGENGTEIFLPFQLSWTSSNFGEMSLQFLTGLVVTDSFGGQADVQFSEFDEVWRAQYVRGEITETINAEGTGADDPDSDPRDLTWPSTNGDSITEFSWTPLVFVASVDGKVSGDLEIESLEVSGDTVLSGESNQMPNQTIESGASVLTADLADDRYGSVPVVETFTVDSTKAMEIPAGAVTVAFELIGGGGGGGSGRRGPDGEVRCGGGGGAGGGYVVTPRAPVSVYSGAITYAVGAGGQGGAAVTTDGTDGNDGANGGETTLAFDEIVKFRGVAGPGGKGGTNATGTGGSGSARAIVYLATGFIVSASNGGSASTSGGTGAAGQSMTGIGPTGGGAGGGFAVGTSSGIGGNGGTIGNTTAYGVAGGLVGNNGNQEQFSLCGTGGGGSSSVAAYDPEEEIPGSTVKGGDGGNYGGGGGGGHSSRNGQEIGGPGGNGAPGLIRMLVWYS